MIERNVFRFLLLVSAVLIATPVQVAMGQAYCALRDPVRALYEAYPDADGHRSIIKTVTVDDRTAISKLLPFTIHFDELGRHTLYVLLREGQPIGLLHVRSERGRYGLAEFAWSLDLHGRITDITIQRCRNADLREAANDDLRARLRGADVATILGMLDEEGWSDDSRVLLRSAAKTAAVTRIVWEEDILPAEAKGRASIAWPGIDPVLALQPFDHSNVASDSGLEAESMYVWSVSRPDGSELGSLVRSPWSLGEHQAELWWQLDQRGRIIEIDIQGRDSDRIESSFREVVGLDLSKVDQCATAAGVAAKQVLLAVNNTVKAKPRSQPSSR
jgi:hypothetical protein